MPHTDLAARRASTKKYLQSPKGRAVKARYNAKPEVRARHNEYVKKHHKGQYAKHRDIYLLKRAIITAIRRNNLAAFKASLSCILCDENHPEALDFHHPAGKDFTVGTEVPRRCWKTLIKEIEQCILLCANCHRRIHNDPLLLEWAKTLPRIVVSAEFRAEPICPTLAELRKEIADNGVDQAKQKWLSLVRPRKVG